MDDLNMLHIEADSVLDLGHGVRIASQHDINSCTMVCFLDGRTNFHYGFAYRSGSNLRVVTWQNNARKNKVVPKGSLVIAFNAVTTVNTFKDGFTVNDFNPGWFDGAAQELVNQELLSFVDKRAKIEEIVQALCDLNIGELDEVVKKIEGIKNPPIN